MNRIKENMPLSGFRQIADEWLGPPIPSKSCNRPDLPAALLDFYGIAAAHGYEGGFGQQDHLLACAELRSEGDKTRFLEENQGAFVCAYLQKALQPTVWVRVLGEDWVDTKVSLNSFLVTYGLRELVYGSPFWASLIGAPSWLLERSLCIWHAGTYIRQKCSFFWTGRLLVLEEHDERTDEKFYFVGSKTSESIQELRNNVDSWNLP